jgi:hypothetical protein
MNKWMVEEIESDVGARWVITAVHYFYWLEIIVRSYGV